MRFVLGLAFLLRVFAAWFSMSRSPKDWFFSRGIEMGFLANSLVHGQGLASPFGYPTGPTAMFAPVYPMLVAGFFRVFGSYSAGAAAGLVVVQIVANLLTIWLLMEVARREFDGRVALVAGLIWTLSPPLWFVPTIFWDTSITLCLIMGLMALALRVSEGGGWKMWIGFGGACGLAALFNPALVPMLVVMFLLLGWRGVEATLRPVVLGGVVFLLVFSVWPIRNARVMHAFVPLRTAPGLDLWMGNHQGASGYLETADFPIYNHAEFADYQRMGELAYTQAKGASAVSYIAGHPGVFARLTALRIWRFWAGAGTRGGSPLFVMHAVFTTALGFVGMWMMVRRRRWMLVAMLAVPLILFPLPYYVTHAEFRFRLVVDPILTLLAAFAAVEFVAKYGKADGAAG
jgi:4-amino-4-deoxy-L-arabinose transferase-like glycosyltransferase